MRAVGMAVLVLALLGAASPSPTALAPWIPLPVPTQPPPSSDELTYRTNVLQASYTNLLFAIFAPYCEPGDKIASIALNGKTDAPVYPVTVTCTHSRFLIVDPKKAPIKL